jgi:hypothetical protein
MNPVLLAVFGLALVSFQARASEISFKTLPTTLENGTLQRFYRRHCRLENVTDSHTISSYQYALWCCSVPTVAQFGDSASLLNQAGLDVSSGAAYSAYDRLQVYTPSESAASNQELLGMGGSGSTISNVTSAPEPGTTVLIGVGLLALGLLGRGKSGKRS